MNACPLGWHLPTHDELTTLERAICTSGTCATDFPYDEETEGYRGTDEGYKLKSTANWNNDGTGDNSSGFNVLPAGTRSNLGVLVNVGSHGLWWSSSPDGIMDAWRRYLYYDYSTIGRISGTQAGGYSVRCLAGT
ncbi:MAG: FISUMP domain-containing protein [Bacilli bacterium]|nr:FISUMP domain-containing protein [Bacilli bacterium]